MSGEKTEQATPKRLKKARDDGQVAKSAEFSGAIVMTAVIVTLLITITSGVALIAHFIRTTIDAAFSPTPDVAAQLYEGAVVCGFVIAPVVGVAFFVSLFVSYLQVGPGFSMKAVLPDAQRINPGEGFKKMVSHERIFDLVKMLAKLLFISVIVSWVFARSANTIVSLGSMPFDAAMQHVATIVWQSVGFVVAALLLIATVDLLWQRHLFAKKMRMSKQEVKDEYRESEGDPFIKGKRRRLHQALVREAGLKNVKRADVVVVNPTHVAAAIQYDADQSDAPIVLASGYGETAERIKKEATKYAIPTVHNVALARSLAELDVMEQIPEELFDAVAEVLRYVYALEQV